MTSALTINGFDIPVLRAGWREDSQEIGERHRAANGLHASSIRGEKFKWQGSAQFLVKEQTFAFQSLLRGRGFTWHFDDLGLYADEKGLAPLASTGCTPATPGHVADCGDVEITSGSDLIYAIPWSVHLPWSIWVWEYYSSAWHSWVGVDANGTMPSWYLDGDNDGPPDWWPWAGRAEIETDASWQFAIRGQWGGTYLSDLSVVPYPIPTDWTLTWAAALLARTTPYPAAPYLEVGGSLISDTVVYRARGTFGSTRTTARGSLPRAETVDFALEED